MGFNVGPRVTRATGGSISRQGNFVVHQFPPQHVTDGLVGFVDPSNHDSYDELRQNTINDISGAGIIGPGTLNGNWNSAGGTKNWIYDKGGYWRFDGNISANWSGNSTMPVLREHTVEMWIKITGSPSGGFHVFFQKDGGYSGGMVYGIRASSSRQIQSHIFHQNTDSAAAAYQQSTTLLTQGQWYHVAVTYDTNLLLKVYIDGVDNSDTANYSGIGTHFPRPITGGGNLGTGDSRYCHADIGLWRLYNRALSATEIAQNYKAEKLRFYPYSDTFTPICAGEKGKVQALVVAGGGGGGASGGGGGAGGLIFNNSVTVTTNTAVNVVVGAGGTGAHLGAQRDGIAGGNSSFGTIVATGGGFGGGGTKDGGDGGSGGGGGRDSTSYNDLSTPVAGQGNAGGGSYDHSASAGGGGGGAGSAGGNGSVGGASDTATTGLYGGAGGSGLAYSITGETKVYAAGGAGGQYQGGQIPQGGSGLGGNGGMQTLGGDSGGSRTGGHGMPDTGSGGGGGGGTNGGTHDPAGEGGGGGNGTVIVTYPAEDYNAELLIVAGGGGGGAGHQSDAGGGGGGAGGLLYYSSVTIFAGKSYLVSTGDKGSGSTDNTEHASNGKNSFFGDKIAIGGGGGGSTRDSSPVPSGGSGGAAGSDVSPNTGGSGTDGQGHKGGDNATGFNGAGGGGAGEAGEDAPSTSTTSGAGGDGLAYSITGSSTYYAGGGGGGKYVEGTGDAGAGGAGGGGAGGKGANGSDATANTGGGGGGGGKNGSTAKSGGNGGTGIVIIAYKGPQRGEGGTIDQTSRPGYTIHKFTDVLPNRFIG